MSEKMNTSTAVEFTELKGQLQRIEDAIMTMKEKNEEMADDVSKIKEAIYNPDQGIYSRLKELEAWKASVSRIMWLLATGALGSIGAAVWQILKNS
jgi:archaellum component FlaC